MIDWLVVLDYFYYALGVLFILLLIITIRIYGGIAFVKWPATIKYKYYEYKKKKQEEEARMLKEL